MAVQVAPLCEAEDKSVSAPAPTPAPRPSNAGAGVRVAQRPLSELPGGKDHPAHSQAVPGRGLHVLSPHPKPLLSADPPPAPAPHLLRLPSSAAAAAASAPAGSARLPLGSLRLPQPISTPPLPWPRSPTPSLPLPSTGSRDSDKGCAAHPHPQTGTLPTSPIARELRGSERQFSREPSPWQRLLRRHPGVRTAARAGAMWGLKAVGNGSRSQGMRMKQGGLW